MTSWSIIIPNKLHAVQEDTRSNGSFRGTISYVFFSRLMTEIKESLCVFFFLFLFFRRNVLVLVWLSIHTGCLGLKTESDPYKNLNACLHYPDVYSRTINDYHWCSAWRLYRLSNLFFFFNPLQKKKKKKKNNLLRQV